MTFNEYQAAALETAFYPPKGRIIYPALKLAGEAGEVAEKVGKIIRDDQSRFHRSQNRDAILKELGDVLWYCAALARDMNLKLEDVAAANIAKLKGRAERGTLSGSGDDR